MLVRVPPRAVGLHRVVGGMSALPAGVGARMSETTVKEIRDIGDPRSHAHALCGWCLTCVHTSTVESAQDWLDRHLGAVDGRPFCSFWIKQMRVQS